MPESDTPNTTDDPRDEGSQTPESPPKIRLSLKKTPSADTGQAPEATSPPKKSVVDTSPSGDIEPSKPKLSLGLKKEESPKEEEAKSEKTEAEAGPFDIKPKPVEGGTSLNLGIKSKSPEAAAEVKPDTPPARAKKPGIKIRGLTTKPFTPAEPVKDQAAAAPSEPPTSAEADTAPPPSPTPPPAAVKAPPPTAKPAPPPPPVKKKPVPAPPPPKAKVKLSKPPEAKKKAVKAPPPPKAKAKQQPKDTGKDTEKSNVSPIKLILGAAVVVGIFAAVGYFVFSTFSGSPGEKSAETVAVAPADEAVDSATTPAVADSTPAPVQSSDTSAGAVASFQDAIEQGPALIEVATPTTSPAPEPAEIQQHFEPVQDENIMAFIDNLVIKGTMGGGSSAKILVGSSVIPVGAVVDETLGIIFSGINKSTHEIIFTDTAGAVYNKSY